jgi:hypothetical protein
MKLVEAQHLRLPLYYHNAVLEIGIYFNIFYHNEKLTRSGPAGRDRVER